MNQSTKLSNLETEKEAIFELLREKPFNYRTISAHFKQDEDIALLACQYDVDNYGYIPDKLRQSKSFLLKVIQFQTVHGLMYGDFNNLIINKIPPLLKDSEQVCRSCIDFWKSDNRTFNMSAFSFRLRNNKGLAKYCMSLEPSSFAEFGDKVTNNLSLAIKACVEAPYIFSNYDEYHPFVTSGKLLDGIYEKSVCSFYVITKHYRRHLFKEQIDVVPQLFVAKRGFWLKQFHQAEKLIKHNTNFNQNRVLETSINALNEITVHLTETELKEIDPLTAYGKDAIVSRQVRLLVKDDIPIEKSSKPRRQTKMKLG